LCLAPRAAAPAPGLRHARIFWRVLDRDDGGADLCAEGGISCVTVENQAAYVAGWLKCLEDDSRAVVIAAAQAQRATDLILGRQPEAQ